MAKQSRYTLKMNNKMIKKLSSDPIKNPRMSSTSYPDRK